MSRYRLPEALGGGEYEANGRISSGVYGDHSGLVILMVDGYGVWVPERVLTEVEPPLPPEPPVGSVVLDRNGYAWQRGDADWWCTHQVVDQSWDELNGGGGPLTLLVPEPQALVTLPWCDGPFEVRLRYEDGGGHPVQLTHSYNFDTKRYVLSIARARTMARALISAANAADRKRT